MNQQEYRYCPHCGDTLITRTLFNQSRPACSSCEFIYFRDPKVAVIGLVTVEDSGEDKVLLVQRAVSPAKGKWSLPGGYMDAGEMPTEALQREFSEEVGLPIEVGEVLHIFPMAGPDVVNRGIVLAFHATVVGKGLPALEANDDVQAAQWFTHDAVPPNLAFDSTKMLLEQWRQTIKDYQ